MPSDEFFIPLPPPMDGYAAGTKGNIKSITRYVYRAASARRPEGTKLVRGTLLKPYRRESGHEQVVPGRGAGSRDVHVMVARAFLGPKPAGMEVLHRNGVAYDNRPENLRYGTRGENTLDDWAHGKMRANWRLTPDDVRAIRWLREQGVAVRELADAYGVSYQTVYGVCRGNDRGTVDD